MGQISCLIDWYTDLQRIRNAQDRDAEIAYQIRMLKAKLEVFGIDVTELTK